MNNSLGMRCRKYRNLIGATLKEIEGSGNIGLLSAFEMGRSSNLIHFLKYLDFAKEVNDLEQFINIVIKGE